MKLIKAKFSIGESPEFEGYYNPLENWNGFACPLFPEESAVQIAKYFHDNPKEEVEIIWLQNRMFLTEDISGPKWNVKTWSIRPEIVSVNGTDTKVYNIRNTYWCWEVKK